MRDLIRLVGVGALVFLVVGFALIYSRDSAFRYGVGAFFYNGWGAIGRTVGAFTGSEGANGPDMQQAELRLLRPKQTLWMGLATFPDQTEIRFPVPAIGGFLGGELDLQFDVQLAQGGDGLLSIGVNGTRRSEIVLNAGHNAYSVRIPLDEADLLANHVLVTFGARGTTNSGQICPTDAANSGVAINILPESALVIKTMREADHPETALIVMPEPLQIVLGQEAEMQARSVWAMQRMKRAGVDARLIDAMATRPALEIVEGAEEPVTRAPNGNIVLAGPDGIGQAIAYHRADLLFPGALTAWPISAASLTTETTARNFRGSKRWTIPYRIADLPDGLTPTRFDLALRTSTLAGDFEWVVRVSLNGNLLQTKRLPGDTPDIRVSVDLPIGLQGLSNAILIELIDTSPNESICRAGPDAQAQLLPESQLQANGLQPQQGWGALVRQLAAADFVSPGHHGVIDLTQATHAAEMLGQFLPANARMLFAAGEGATMLTLLDKQGLVALIDEIEAGTRDDLVGASLITGTGSSVINPLSLHQLGHSDMDFVINQMHATDIAFVVHAFKSP